MLRGLPCPRHAREGTMTGAEAIVLGFIIAAFAIFGATLGWLSSEAGRRPLRTAANDEARQSEARPSIAKRPSAWQPRRS